MDDPALWVAIGGVIATLTTLVTALTLMWKAIKENTATTNETHAMVNSKHDEDVTFRADLIGTLTANNIDVPLDPGIATARAREQHKRDRGE